MSVKVSKYLEALSEGCEILDFVIYHVRHLICTPYQEGNTKVQGVNLKLSPDPFHYTRKSLVS